MGNAIFCEPTTRLPLLALAPSLPFLGVPGLSRPFAVIRLAPAVMDLTEQTVDGMSDGRSGSACRRSDCICSFGPRRPDRFHGACGILDEAARRRARSGLRSQQSGGRMHENF